MTENDPAHAVTRREFGEFREEMRGSIEEVKTAVRGIEAARQISPATIAVAFSFFFTVFGIVGALYIRDQSGVQKDLQATSATIASLSGVVSQNRERIVAAETSGKYVEKMVREHRRDRIEMIAAMDTKLQREQDLVAQALQHQDTMLQREMDLKNEIVRLKGLMEKQP